MPVAVNARIVIPDEEIEITSIRASGPGGQHVNKTESAVRLRFDAENSRAIDEFVRQRLRTVAGRRMTAAGDIVIVAQRFRSREANRQDAIGRLIEIVADAATVDPVRRRTRPPRSAKRAMQRAKLHRKEIKHLRGRVRSEED